MGTRIHGQRNSRLYKIWAGMKERCSNPNYHGWADYGGRGISVCEEWLAFIPFRDWATKSGYESGLTIDRENNDLGYCPGNCRWATLKQQMNNRRSNVLVTIGHETRTVTQWAESIGVPVGTMQSRLRDGWTGLRLLSPIDLAKQAASRRASEVRYGQ